MEEIQFLQESLEFIRNLPDDHEINSVETNRNYDSCGRFTILEPRFVGFVQLTRVTANTV